MKRLTNGRGVDVVFEHVGAATWDQSVYSLAVGGRLVTCGATSGFESKINVGYLFARQLSILGSFMGEKAELFSVLELFKRGLLKPESILFLPSRKQPKLTSGSKTESNLEKWFCRFSAYSFWSQAILFNRHLLWLESARFVINYTDGLWGSSALG